LYIYFVICVYLLKFNVNFISNFLIDAIFYRKYIKILRDYLETILIFFFLSLKIIPIVHT